MNDMKILSDSEIELISGGMTENQCIGAFTLGGVIFGGLTGGPAGAGLWGGFGGVVGMLACGSLVK